MRELNSFIRVLNVLFAKKTVYSRIKCFHSEFNSIIRELNVLLAN